MLLIVFTIANATTTNSAKILIQMNGKNDDYQVNDS